MTKGNIDINSKIQKIEKNLLTKQIFNDIITTLREGEALTRHLGIAQLVARYLGVVEAVGSNPATQTSTKLRLVVISRSFYYI